MNPYNTSPVRTSSSSNALVKVKSLSKFFPVKKGLFRRQGFLQALDSVSFDIHEGEVLGLVGESGCGKSTLGRTILRLHLPTSGKILFNGHDITSLSERKLRPLRSKMQVIFQDPYASLNPRKTARQIINLPLQLYFSYSAAEREQRVKELLALVGLSPTMAGYYPHQFSSGQRQRVGIARALAVNPKFIIADEPVSALDVSIQAQILNLLEKLRRELGLTYLFISHDLGVIGQVSDRIAVMYLGKIVEIGNKEQIINSPSHPYTQALLESVLELGADAAKRKPVLSGETPDAMNPPPGCNFHPRCPSVIKDVCQQDEPKMRHSGQKHFAACHLVEEAPT